MNIDNNKVQYSVLKRYFLGETSQEENEQVSQWLNDPGSKFKVDHCLRILWDEIGSVPVDISFDRHGVLDRIHHTRNLRRKNNDKYHVKLHDSFSIGKIFKQIARVAAIFLLPLMLYLSWEVLSQRMWLKHQNEIVYNEIICPLGMRSQFELPDGTTGSLNNGSRLKYPVKFYGDLREVELVGEAYFDVKKNKQHPFIINTNGLDVRVLGTRLNICSYPEDNYQEFTLESGTIELLMDKEDRQITFVVMKPGQHAVYKLEKAQLDFSNKQDIDNTQRIKDKDCLKERVEKMKSNERIIYETDDGTVEFKYGEVDYYTLWKEGMLVLRNDPMPLLLKRIERWYNVKFHVLDDKINEYTYWATFEQENLDQVLKLLALTGPIQFEKHPKEKDENGMYKPQVIDVVLNK